MLPLFTTFWPRCILSLPDDIKATDSCQARREEAFGDEAPMRKVEAAQMNYVPASLPPTTDPVTGMSLLSKEGLDPDAALLQAKPDKVVEVGHSSMLYMRGLLVMCFCILILHTFRRRGSEQQT